MKKIDKSLLKPGYSTTKKEGFYARFDKDERLIHFGYYHDGRASRTLDVDHENGVSTSAIHTDITLKDSDDEEMYLDSIASQIGDIYQSVDGELRCNFCNRTQSQVKKLIAGPAVFICNECVDLCNDIVAEEVPEPE